LAHAAVAAGFFVCMAISALAEEATYCVTCKNPDQTYRCKITGAGRPNDALKLYCVIRTAKDGDHASCSAERTAACIGAEKVYAYEGPAIPPEIANDPRVKRFLNQHNQAGNPNNNHRAAEKKKNDAPKTLIELGGRAVSASRKGLRNARAALGGSSASDEPTGSVSNSDQSLPPPPPPASVQASEDESTAAPRGNRVTRAAQSASSAVGGFARKSYRCVVSLFRNCRGEAAEGQAPD
jgi:hypothetical protein